MNGAQDGVLLLCERRQLAVVGIALFHRLLGRRVRVVFAESVDEAAVLFRALRCLATIEVCDYDLADFQAPDGVNMFFERERMLEAISWRLFEAGRSVRLPAGAMDHVAIEEFLTRYAVMRWAEPIARVLLLWGYAGLLSEARRPWLIAPSLPLPAATAALFNTRVRLLLVPNVLWLIWPIANLARFTFLVMRSIRKPRIRASDRWVALQMVKGPVDRGRGTDFDWLPASGLEMRNVVYYLDGKATKIASADELNAWCRARDVLLADLRTWGPSARDSEFLRDWLGSLAASLHAIFASRGMPPWRGYIVDSIILWSLYASRWRAFHRSYGTRAEIGVPDTNIDAIPCARALESLGGLELSFQFSGTGNHSYMHCRPLARHQFACWGHLEVEMVRSSQAQAPHRVAPRWMAMVGNMRKHRAQIPLPADIQARIAAANKKKCIAAFDAVPTHIKIQSHRQVRGFYDALIGLMRQLDDAVILFKPQASFAFTAEQQRELEELVAQQRLILVPTEVTPDQLFAIADLVVATPIYASILMEACSWRRPIVCYDRTHWPHVQRNKLPASIVASDSDQLLHAVKRILERGVSEPELAEIAAYQRYVDPFDDDRGMERFGEYVGAWVRGLKRFGSADQALEPVMAEYSAAYGTAAVQMLPPFRRRSGSYDGIPG